MRWDWAYIAEKYVGNCYWREGGDMRFKVNADSLELGNLDKFAGNLNK